MNFDYEDTFERADAGASLTFPICVGEIKKGGYMCIEKRPCKVVEYDCHKTGKHGHAKATIVAIDIFTNKKMEDSMPASANVDVPNIDRKEYSLYSVDEENFVSMLDVRTNELRSDIKLPDDTENDEVLAKRIRKALEDGKDCSLTVLAAMGIEKIVECKEI